MKMPFSHPLCFHSPFRALSKLTLSESTRSTTRPLVNSYYCPPRINYGKKTAKGRQKDEVKSKEKTHTDDPTARPLTRSKIFLKKQCKLHLQEL